MSVEHIFKLGDLTIAQREEIERLRNINTLVAKYQEVCQELATENALLRVRNAALLGVLEAYANEFGETPYYRAAIAKAKAKE